MTRRFIVDLIDSDETDRFVGKYGADEITNMTNGDVIKALFPNEKWERCPENRYNRASMQSDNMGINMELWNAPYERGNMRKAKFVTSKDYDFNDREDCYASLYNEE